MARQPSYADVRPVVDFVTDEEAGDALAYLSTSTHDAAVAEAQFKLREDQVKMAEAAGVSLSKETNATRQQADARITPTYVRAVEARYEAEIRYREILLNRRAAELKVEVWRTLSANKRNK